MSVILARPAGGGSSVLSSMVITVSGTIDDSNTSFTAAVQPSVLVINGSTYRTTGGAITWTYLAGTITLSVAVGLNGSIFGLR